MLGSPETSPLAIAMIVVCIVYGVPGVKSTLALRSTLLHCTIINNTARTAVQTPAMFETERVMRTKMQVIPKLQRYLVGIMLLIECPTQSLQKADKTTAVCSTPRIT